MRARTSSGSGVLGGGGEPDEVAEEDGDDLALLLDRNSRSLINVAEQKPQNRKPSGFSLRRRADHEAS